MNRILGIDYGTKWTGIAATDPMQIIVNPLKSVVTEELNDFFDQYLSEEPVSKVVFGFPTHKDGLPTKVANQITNFANKLKSKYPDLDIVYQDEAFSSQRAASIIRASGAKKSKRQNKVLINTVSAVVILQEYLGHI